MIRNLLLISIVLLSWNTFSQNVFSDIQNTLSDLVIITDNFVTPGAEASHFQSSIAWVNSAKPLDKYTLDVSFHANALFIPSRRKSYSIRNSDLNIFQLRGGASEASIPTVLGGNSETFFDFEIFGEEQELQAFEGIDQKVVAHPFLQASVGLWLNTELTVRYAPPIPIDGVSYDIYGVGLKHSISQYWNDEMNPNAFQLAIAATHARFNLNIVLDTFKIDTLDGALDSILSANSVDIAASSWLFQLVGSKRINRFDYFGNLGVNSSAYSYQIEGTDGILIDLLNDLLDVLDSSYTSVRGELGVNYHFGDWYVSNSLAVGSFINYNASIHYTF